MGPLAWLEERLDATQKEAELIAGKEVAVAPDPSVTLLPRDADPSGLPVALLKAEADRLTKLIGIDAADAAKFKALNLKLEAAGRSRTRLVAQITKGEGADERIKSLISKRRDSYKAVFEAIERLESELERLYSPLLRSLEGAEGALGKLGFVVRRHVDVEMWAGQGEELLDLRRDGPFRGKGALLATITDSLLDPWQNGDAEAAASAMREFMRKYETAIRTHMLETMDPKEWNLAVSRWFRDTRHITVRYGIQYDGVDIERLSPGTRGIVLLFLYLAIDQEDDRPLTIDQPEENLDPQSVFDELVGRFRAAKTRRQIIIVTHNANLVVNTDADQVIVASAGRHRANGLPEIAYESGGLESPAIRQRVCDILEGGEMAFKERARRLRLDL